MCPTPSTGRFRASLLAVACVAPWTCAVSVLHAAAVPEYPVPYTVPSVEEVRAVVDRMVAHAQAETSLAVLDKATGKGLEPTPAILASLPAGAALDDSRGSLNRWDYPNGVIFSALDRLGEVTGDAHYYEMPDRFYDFTFTWMPAFRSQEDRTHKSNDYSRMIHMSALDHCGAITAALIRTQLRHPDPRYREWIDVVGKYIAHGQFRLSDGTLARQRPQPVSLWADDAYMGISFLAQMGRLTGDETWWHDGVRQVTQLSDRLYVPSVGLWDHGWSENTDGYDPHFYWARANGWVLLAETELLAELPPTFEGRDRVLALYRQHLRALVEVQDGTGLWHNLLNRPETYTETSASGMFVYALARGVNEGWLSPVYAPPAITGWNGLATRVLADGRVDGICESTTYAQDSTYYTYRGAGADTNFYGSVIYAGAEVMRLLQNPACQLSSPKPNAVNSAMQAKNKDDPDPK